MQYSEQEIRAYAAKVVDATKKTANYDTGLLYRSIKYAYYRRTGKLEFREIEYGAYKGNAKLIENAQKLMPKDIPWTVVFENEEGEEVSIKGTTRTGRKISKKSITNENVSTKNIKKLISLINGKKANDTAERDRQEDKSKPE